jgi:hypothetical protein
MTFASINCILGKDADFPRIERHDITYDVFDVYDGVSPRENADAESALLRKAFRRIILNVPSYMGRVDIATRDSRCVRIPRDTYISEKGDHADEKAKRPSRRRIIHLAERSRASRA